MNTYIIIGVVAVVVLFIIFYVKMTIDEKKGADSREKQKIKDIVRSVVPGGDTYTAAYGTREELALGGGGRRVTATTSYWFYAVAFKAGDLYLVPLDIQEGRSATVSRYTMEEKSLAWWRRKTDMSPCLTGTEKRL